jgi:hypothetical protein
MKNDKIKDCAQKIYDLSESNKVLGLPPFYEPHVCIISRWDRAIGNALFEVKTKEGVSLGRIVVRNKRYLFAPNAYVLIDLKHMNDIYRLLGELTITEK